jgi:predicted transcriptional regulator
MKISLSPELPSQTERLASQQGRKQESLVQEAVERFVDYDEWFVKRVERD